ncbi:MAG: photosynthetic protein synthase I [Proteobacteria bacterium]|nr:photosynthetic protein synthase I [Pseudomonadota bacterium]
MRFKLPGGTRWGTVLAVPILGASLAIFPSAWAGEDFGPVPAIDVKAERAELGKRLFFDRRLSGDAAISCASCHIPEKGFADGLALSKAYPGSEGFRNTPTLINTAHKSAWFHDGRLGTNLNDVTREMITESYLMNMDMRLMQERLKQDPVYVEMFKAAGFGEPSNGAVRKAIPEYLKTLTSRGAPFDSGDISPSAFRGFQLFKGKAGCAACHYGPRFTDDQAHNLGVPENLEIFSDPLRHVTYVTYAMFMGIENYMNVRRDVGAHVRTHKADGSDIGKFMTPGLRELKHTAPYMHNGMFGTLAEVVAFYNAGGGGDRNKDSRLRPLGLTPTEQKDLVAFLEALSGEPLTGPEFVWQDRISTDYPVIENWRETRN